MLPRPRYFRNTNTNTYDNPDTNGGFYVPAIDKKIVHYPDIGTDRYKDKCYGNYLLPVFSHKHKTETQQRGRLKRLCDKVNKTLKKVKALIKYKGKLTWYSARGTFISKMIDNNIHPIVVAQMAGNSPNTIYKHYFKNTKEEVIDRQVEKAYEY